MDIVITGKYALPVGEHWDIPLHTLATRAIRGALADAGGVTPQAIYIGNLLAPVLSHQSNLGALVAEHCGFSGVEAYTVEAAGASGAAALRLAYLAVSSGFVETAVAVGVEKWTDVVGAKGEEAVAQTLDGDFEAVHGMSLTGQAALLTARYMYEYNVPREALGAFPLLAHANAVDNPNAMYRKAISPETYAKAEIISQPLNLYDIAPYADGAAAVVVTRSDQSDVTPQHAVRVAASSVAIDTLALHDRPNPLAFEAARQSVEKAYWQAGVLPEQMDLFELCDAYSIYAALSLEAAGFAAPGRGWMLAQDGALKPGGKLPIMTLGGMKARGNPLGAAGMYSIVEACQQILGEADKAQVVRHDRALVQALGGPASTAITHILESIE